MKFKEFYNWCNERAADGCWGMATSIVCISIIRDLLKIPFWKREKVWKEKYESDVVNWIVKPIDEKMKEIMLNE